MPKMKQYSSYSEWKKDQSSKNKKLITKVSRIISNIDPDLETVVKWSQGCWTRGKDHKFFIHCKPDHIQLGFYVGSKLDDPKNLLQGNGKFVKHVKIFSEDDINKNTFGSLIKQAL